MRHHRVPLAATGLYTPLVLDHVEGITCSEGLCPIAPTMEGLRHAAAGRGPGNVDREALVAALTGQYAGTALSSEVRASLDALGRQGTLTVTTGHQLCLFGGPLYVSFKILNVVRSARRMAEDLGRPVVPLFWMATEDHDRAEIDHAWVAGKRVHWPGDAAGAVGRMVLDDIDPVLQEVSEALGGGAHAGAVRDMLFAAYRPARTLAEATRHLVNALFGRFGVLCVDGDDPVLKALFVPAMREELSQRVTLRSVEKANEHLRGRYSVQAHVRDINLFHLSPGHRRRIVQEGVRYRALGGGPVWEVDRLMEELERHPERFSPNVLMRPLYQETILPNIAYVGGGGELAYWLQLGGLFEALKVPMPAVLLRSGAGFISAKHMRLWQGTGLAVEDLFEPLERMKARVAVRDAGPPVGLDHEQAAMRAFYERLADRVAGADPTLRASVEAHAVRALKGLDHVGDRLLRAAKRRGATTLERMDRVHAALFPHGGLQERRDTILPMLATHGESVLDMLLERLDPMAPAFTLFEED